MVQIEISEDAEEMIFGYVEWLETKNTPGSGSRFLVNLNHFLNRLGRSFPYFSPCSNLILRSKNLFCSSYREWVVAFEIGQACIIVTAFIHKNRLPV